MKTTLILASLLVAFSALTACSSGPAYTNTGDRELRSATPGVVDHNVLPKKSKK